MLTISIPATTGFVWLDVATIGCVMFVGFLTLDWLAGMVVWEAKYQRDRRNRK